MNATVMRHSKQDACMPVNENYCSNLHVTLYFVKYSNSIPFFEEQSYQVNKLLVDSWN